MRLSIVIVAALVVSGCAARTPLHAVPNGRAQKADFLEVLDHAGMVLARIEKRCAADRFRAMQGAAESVNSLPYVTEKHYVVVEKDDVDRFFEEIANTIAATQTHSPQFEKPIEIAVAAIDGMLKAVDENGRYARSATPEVTRKTFGPHLEIRGRIAIVAVDEMNFQTPEEVRGLFEKARRSSPRPSGYVFDLRYNEGGPIKSLEEIADLFLEAGTIGKIINAPDCGSVPPPGRLLMARPDDIIEGAPLVLLVNSGTSGSAEMLVSALVENGRARSIGQRTRGSGYVQSAMPFEPNGPPMLTLTTGEFISPLGNRIGFGLEPSFTVPPANDEADPALSRALELLR